MNNDQFCGVSFWHPKWLQKYATMKWFLAVYGLLGTVQGVSYTYLVVTITTMEKLFHMPSQTTGLVLTGNEIAQILLSLILSYAGGKKNRPLWIAWGMLFCGLSSLVLALPHFIYGSGDEAFHLTKEYYDSIGEQWNSTFLNSSSGLIKKNQPLCNPIQDQVQCKNLVAIVPLVLIFISQFILGVGNTLYYSLGQTFLDDNTKKTNTPLLFAYAMSLRMIGPLLGFGLGYVTLKQFIDPTMTPLINHKDPRWLGAWWLGWILIGLIMMLFSGLLALFPRQLFANKSESRQLTFVSNSSEDDSHRIVEITQENTLSVKDFFTSLKRVLRNRIVIFNNISGIFYILGASGYVTYLGRYMEVQFNQTSQNATSVVGPLSMLGMVLGLLISGWIISRRRPSVSKVLFWNVIIGCVYAIGQFSYMFFYCQNVGVAVNIKEWSSMNFECNQNCHCGDVKYTPVCHQNSEQTFFSPCHAGCHSWDPSKNIYRNCSCLNKFEAIFPTSIAMTNSQSVTKNRTESSIYATNENILKPGVCTKNCQFAFYAFSFFTLLMTWLNSTGKIGNILVNYRAVAERDKAFTQGLTLMMLSLFAFIPGPIIFGKLIDSTCTIWNYSCGERGNCLRYDQDRFRYSMSTLAVVLTICGVIFDALVWHYGKHLDLYMESRENLRDSKESGTERKEAATGLLEPRT